MATILTVDDTASMRQMISFTLSSVGHEVIQACDGHEALMLLKGKKVDLVIADINMPNMDGITLVKSLREQADYKFTPILVLTTESRNPNGSRVKSPAPPAGSSNLSIRNNC